VKREELRVPRTDPRLPSPSRTTQAVLRAAGAAFGSLWEEEGRLIKEVRRAQFEAVDAVGSAGGDEAAERCYQAALLREFFGNPFRPPEIEPSWLAWNDGFIPEQAKLIYDERAFERLPVLGDALEDAGCTDRAILDHCRLPAEHVRGCWLVDALLAKG
jgi:hypothetical protein